ncbi:MAG TPA: rhomboid family intramembrane serine protease [Casimicrobiaceae bacterium]|nr:rhomboid family intramembrane serine protease [Casimicrobiaceae bacterium]
MQIHAPDPAYADSAESRARFRAAAALTLLFVAGLAVIHLVGWALGLDLARFGVHPRDAVGLAGIVTAPLLHGDLAHLASNALPLLIAGTALIYLYPDSSRFVLPAVYLGPGLLVWAFGRDSIHIGASGLVYGIVAYVFVAGILRRDRRAWAVSVLVAWCYGALVWGVLPIKVGVSWETHLAAAAIGVALAFALRHRDVPPRKRYSWEIEGEAGSGSNFGQDLPDAASAPKFESDPIQR